MSHICPICNSHDFKEKDTKDLCPICRWKNDFFSECEPKKAIGANEISLKDYKEKWTRLNSVMFELMEKYDIKKVDGFHEGKFQGLYVEDNKLTNFIIELTQYKIKVGLDFYNVIRVYGFEERNFKCYPTIKKCDYKKNNKIVLDILNTKNPIKTCKVYNLPEVLELLEKADDKLAKWKQLRPLLYVFV